MDEHTLNPTRCSGVAELKCDASCSITRQIPALGVRSDLSKQTRTGVMLPDLRKGALRGNPLGCFKGDAAACQYLNGFPLIQVVIAKRMNPEVGAVRMPGGAILAHGCGRGVGCAPQLQPGIRWPFQLKDTGCLSGFDPEGSAI